MRVFELLEQDEWKETPLKFDEMIPFLQKRIRALQHKKDIISFKASNAKDGLHSFDFNMQKREIDVKLQQLVKQIATIRTTASLT